MLNFVILEYNQDPEVEGTYTDKKFPVFLTKEDFREYVNNNDIYGICQVYQHNEYIEYLKNDDDYVDIPDPIYVFDI
jgi:hypothetical protein